MLFIKEVAQSVSSETEAVDDVWWMTNKLNIRERAYRNATESIILINNEVLLRMMHYFPNRVVDFFSELRRRFTGVLDSQQALDILNFILLRAVGSDVVRSRLLNLNALQFFQQSQKLGAKISNPPTVDSIANFYTAWFKEFLVHFGSFIGADSLWVKRLPHSTQYLIHDFISREGAAQLLRDKRIGTFLLRWSESYPGLLVLVLKASTSIKNILIERDETTPFGCKIMVESGGVRYYSSCWDFVRYYSEAEYYLNGEEKFRSDSETNGYEYFT